MMHKFYVRLSRVHTEYEGAEDEANRVREIMGEPVEVVAVYTVTHPKD